MESGLGQRSHDLEEVVFFSEDGEKMVKKGDLIFPPRKVWMKTFGCQMNYHDTERILSHLKNLNFSQTKDKNEADLILFNTCAIRDLANLKFYSQLGETKHNKAKKKDIIVGVGGCVAQTEGKALIKKHKQLDFAFGTDCIDSINDMVYRTYAGDKKFSVNAWDRSSNFSIETKITHGSPQAFVNIIKGCNKYCSYCIVPYTRGKEKSRRVSEVVEDIEKLIKYRGIQEVTLLGQNVNSFGKDNGESLAQLIEQLDLLEGLELIRYTTSHPYDVSDELIRVHGSSLKLAKHLHLPVQSGSNNVLKRMLREYSVEHFLGLLKKLRASNPNIVLSTDIIVGFPNETDEEFDDTLKLLTLAQFDFIYSYTFSPRNGTKAAQIPDKLSDKTRKERLKKVQEHQLAIQEKIRLKMVGRVYTVLVDGIGTMKGQKKWKGRTSCNRIIHFEGPNDQDNLLWNWIDLKVVSATALSCQGIIRS